MIWVCGTEGAINLDRQSSGKRDWTGAEAWLLKNTTVATVSEPCGLPMTELITKYCKQREADTTAKTHHQIKTFLEQWHGWLESVGVRFADELERVDLEDWKLTITGKTGSQAQRNRQRPGWAGGPLARIPLAPRSVSARVPNCARNAPQPARLIPWLTHRRPATLSDRARRALDDLDGTVSRRIISALSRDDGVDLLAGNLKCFD